MAATSPKFLIRRRVFVFGSVLLLIVIGLYTIGLFRLMIPPNLPLHRAASEGDIQAIEEWLQEHPEDIDRSAALGAIQDYWNMTPLMHAAKNGQHEAAKRLIELGADVNAQNPLTQTALELAFYSDLSMTRLLVEAGADVNVVSRAGNSALRGAVANEQLDVVEYLIGIGADINLPQSSAIYQAVSRESPAMLRAVLQSRQTLDPDTIEWLYAAADRRTDDARDEIIAILTDRLGPIADTP